MKRQQAKFTIEFTIDLDPIPGTFHSASDWINFVTMEFERQKNYNAHARVMTLTTGDKP